MALIIAAIGVVICLILLGITADFLVDWLWFSSVGYLDVFWTTIVAEAEVFFSVFLATAIILWVSGLLASRFARSRHADFEWKRTGHEKSLGSGEASQGPMLAAIANAFAHATSKRLRDLPFAPERVRTTLG